MKSISIFRRRHSLPFLLIGLVVVIVILSVNYWHASTRLADLQQQDEELRKRYQEVFLMKNQLSLKNEILETKVKENVETYDSLRQIRDKKEEEILEQRNELSKSANSLMQKFMKYDCDMKKKAGEKSNAEKVSISGGFCEQAGKKDSGQHRHDNSLIAHLADFFQGKNVGSFGEGPGEYKRLLMATGKLKSYTGYDGSPYASENSGGTVQYLDLTIDAFGLPEFDWILSLEVAEHIPADFESKFLSNIARHAKEGVVMSWGKPGQVGLHHVNNRPLSYIISVMDSLGFIHDPIASKALKDTSSISYLKDNTNVYRRNASHPLLKQFL